MGTTATKSLNKKSIASYLGEYGAFIALVLLVVVISVISPEFRTAGNFLNLLRQATFNGLIAFGMTCVILSDGIDLSVGSTLALSAVICAKLIMQLVKSHQQKRISASYLRSWVLRRNFPPNMMKMQKSA